MTILAEKIWRFHPVSDHPNKNSFSTSWYKKPIRTNDLPVLTGFFRVGNHYLIELISYYFNSHVWVDGKPKRNNSICFCSHDHDHCLDAVTPAMFLYRKNIYNVMYSLYRSQYCETKQFNLSIDTFLKYRTNDYKYNIKKWVKKADTIIVYENLLNEPEKEFRKITNFFNEKFILEKFIETKEVVTQEYVASKWKKTLPNYFGNNNEKYYLSREKWIEEHSPKIKEYFLDERHVKTDNVDKLVIL